MGPLSPLLARADDHQDRVAKRAFLLDLKERVQDFMQMNHGYLLDIEACLSGRPSSRPCEPELAKIRNNIQVLYPDFRRHWILMGLVRWQTLRQVFQNYRAQLMRNSSGKGELITIPIGKVMVDYPIASDLSEEEIPVPAVTAAEVLSALHLKRARFEGISVYENLNDYIQYVCQQAVGAERAAPVCGPIRVELKVNSVGELSLFVDINKSRKNQVVAVDQVLRQIEFKTQFWMSDFYKGQEEAFYEMLQENPYVALVSSTRPTDKELLRVFSLMTDRSAKSLQEFDSKWEVLGRENIEMKDLLPLMTYAPIVDDVLNFPGENMELLGIADYAQISQMLNSDYSSYEMNKMMKEIGFLIAANVAVCYAGGRFVKWAGTLKKLVQSARMVRLKEVFNPFCYNLTGAAVNLWFIRDAKMHYAKTYREVFSSADGDSYLRELHALPEAEQMIFWSYVTAPVGIGATFILKALAVRGVKLSKGFQEYLGKRLVAVRGE
jgi:hypothetical protein